MDNRLDGKVAIVSGGSSGIGAATVRMLAASGAHVVIGFNSGEERARHLAGSLPGDGHMALRMSLEDSGSVRQAATDVEQKLGRADVLVNSAGFTKPVPHADLEGLDDEWFDKMLIGNVRGTFAAIRAFAPLLRASGQGVIVNVSSVAAITGSGSSLVYAACKAAIDTMSLSLARSLAPEIRVLCVSPGAVPTDFVAGRDRGAVEKIAATSPLKRVVETEDVARTIMGCITHLTMSTGVRIVVDGGRSLG